MRVDEMRSRPLPPSRPSLPSSVCVCVFIECLSPWGGLLHGMHVCIVTFCDNLQSGGLTSHKTSSLFKTPLHNNMTPFSFVAVCPLLPCVVSTNFVCVHVCVCLLVFVYLSTACSYVRASQAIRPEQEMLQFVRGFSQCTESRKITWCTRDSVWA